MNKDQILDRINLLMAVYRWTLKHNRGLTVSQRICLQMERAKLFAALAEINEGKQTANPSYTIPMHLEQKVQHLYKTINQ